MVALFYFLLYRPHKKEQTRRKDMINRLQKGTHVMTIGGIYGDVTSIGEKTIRMKIAEHVEIEVAKAAIAKKALPNCNITFIAGADMKTALSGFLSILNDENPQSIGGTLPDDAFYYGAEA